MKVRKISLIVVTVIALITILSTSTFAWFELNKEVWVDGMGLNVTAGEGIIVSVDGLNYTSNISESNIKKAIVAKYKGYSFHSDETEKGVLKDEKNNTLSDSKINELYSELKLKPVTSYNGVEMLDKYGNVVNQLVTYNNENEGWYYTFDLYFKTSTQDLIKPIPVYLYNGTVKTLDNGTKIKPYSITSDSETVKLKNKLTTFGADGKGVEYGPNVENKTEITVSSADAIRFSATITNNTKDITKIFEPNLGLGSYGTDLSEEYYNNATASYLAKYDGNKNAALTYANNRGFGGNTMNYSDMPRTITDNGDDQNLQICTLSKENSYTAKVTFRFWLEGFDADCIDGLKNTITSQLSFTTAKESEIETLAIDFMESSAEDSLELLKYTDYKPSKVITPALPIKREGFKFWGWSIINKNDQSEVDFDYSKTADQVFEQVNLNKIETLVIIPKYQQQ